MKALLNTAGGIRYHLRALFAKDDLWKPFREQVALWLQEWKPDAKHLVLVGPSGGYCLKREFLNRFDRITVWDPDPLAEAVFKTRYSDVRAIVDLNFIWKRSDFFNALLRAEFDPGNFSKIYLHSEKFCICFSNILGQLIDIHDSELMTYEDLLKGLARFLKNVPWVSFHDRLSGSLKPRIIEPVQSKDRLDATALRQMFYSAEHGGELWEHDLDILMKDKTAFAYWVWPLTKKRHHIIEGVQGNSQSVIL